MATTGHHSTQNEESLLGIVRRAFAEFLWVPSAVVIGFLLLAAGTYWLDHIDAGWLKSVNEFLRTHIFTDVAATSSLLSTTAGGLMTITSVTISVLLLALQQSASAMTTAVFDQFLRRRHNQLYFGFFVGFALYALITLATVNAPFNPVIGATVVLLFTVLALFLLIILLYTTVNQMRPAEIINTIHHLTLAARRRQLVWIGRTRRHPQLQTGVQQLVKAPQRGMVTAIDLEEIAAQLKRLHPAADPEVDDGQSIGSAMEVEIVLTVAIGDYVAFHDLLATVTAPTKERAQAIGEAVRQSVTLERQRDITRDPAYGIQQLTTIAWSSISSAKSDLEPGLLTIYSLRDILAHWVNEETDDAPLTTTAAPDDPATTMAVVYRDNVLPHLLSALESLAVISSESMQHPIFAEVLRTFADLFDRLPTTAQQHTEQIILRLLSALGDHVVTTELDQALSTLQQTMQAAQKSTTAHAVQQAQTALRQTVGTLHSRTTRAGQQHTESDS